MLLTDEAERRRAHALALLDVDGLAEINRAYGWPAGDAVVGRLSVALLDAVNADEQAAHWAGDQFVVVMPGATRHRALRRTRQIVAYVQENASTNGRPVRVTAGTAVHPADGSTNSALIEAATLALRRAKRRKAPSTDQ
ncbi:MAG TPA: GGDEF domain-containing protein [Acidimicrobiales bacterium]|nr:GGDEF domain-containing protein [Acidimicrobiales bacterium]